MTVPALPSNETTSTTVDPTVPVLPPIEQVRGKEYPKLEDADRKKVEWVEKLYQEGNGEGLARFKQATRNVLYANNRQHIGWKKSKREWEDLPIADRDIRVTYNYIIVMLRARTQRLVSSEVAWRGIPDSNSSESHDRVKRAVSFVKARFLGLEMSAKSRQALMQANLTGIAAFKSFWNPSIGPLTAATMMLPEAQPVIDPVTQMPVADEMGQPLMQEVLAERFVGADGRPVTRPEDAFQFRPGDTDTAIRTIFHLRLNPEAHGWTESEGLRWLIDTDIVSLAVARERYPKIAHLVRPMQGGDAALSFERMVRGSATMRDLGSLTSFVSAGTASTESKPEELTSIREYWEMRSAFFPKGRLIVAVGGAVAYDGPWPHGVFPYAPVFGEPAVMSPYGRPPVNDMISPQDVLNREATAIAKEMWLSGVGKFVAWDMPGVPDQISSSDDSDVIRIPMRTMLGGRNIGDVFKRLDPAQVSGDRWRLIQEAKTALFDVGAYHEVSRGQIPPGLDSGVAIQLLVEQESAQLKEAVEAFKRTLIAWARHQIAIAKWGYTEDRWVPIDRPDLGFMLETISGLSLPDPETIGLDIEHFRPQSESAVRAEAKELLGMGAIDPRRALRIMDLGSGFDEAFVSQTRHYARARRENLAFERGEFVEQIDPMAGVSVVQHVDGSPFLLPQDDDHLIHIEQHHELLLDDTKPWEVRQAVLRHVESHRQSAMMQAMAAAPPAQGAPPSAQGGGEQQQPPAAA